METTETTTPLIPFDVAQTAPGSIKVIRRNGSITPFNNQKITKAVTKAFKAILGDSVKNSSYIQDTMLELTQKVENTLKHRVHGSGTIHIEDIQDQVELELMRLMQTAQHATQRKLIYRVTKAYLLHRDKRRREREEAENISLENAAKAKKEKETVMVALKDGSKAPLDLAALEQQVAEICTLPDVSASSIIKDTQRNLFEGVPILDVNKALIMSTRILIEKEPNYSYVAARLLLNDLRDEALHFLNLPIPEKRNHIPYADYFATYIDKGIALELLDPRLKTFDLAKLAASIEPNCDHQFTYLGLQTLYDRYFLHWDGTRFELPQAFFLRVAMGLALNEQDKEARAIEFYHLLSSFDFMSSTPTLFNSGTLRSQLSSCYLTTIPDDLADIYGAIKDNALLSKYAGGLGNDWTPVRAMGAKIKGTNGKSQGVIPFLKVANDTAVAVNQGGKRKGAVCAYLEVWHKDIEEFLELRKNTGDERRRTHDMNTAAWIPDLFMKRVTQNADWTLFSPDETADLHDLYGAQFEKAYIAYETAAKAGKIKNVKTINANVLWRKLLTMLFETGHPWVTFKDPCNLRSPQQHTGVVHSSNLCTEITLNTSHDEIAVCNLGSINLVAHMQDNKLNQEKLHRTIHTAIRMLDNVIDINYYSVPQAKNSNFKHRPIGLGIMGFQDSLYKMRMAYASNEAVEFADRTMEIVSYYAILASTQLAAERGSYSSYPGSLWSQGILPIDSIRLLAENRGSEYLDLDTRETLDWASLRERVKTIGMRNSNVLAIAPTATISNICGVSQSIEPTYQNLFVKSNLSGEFTVINPYLVDDLKARGLWDDVMVNDLKYYDGSVAKIHRIPDELKQIYATAFEISPTWLVDAGARRQKWIDQSQSLNLYMAQPSGKKLDQLYKHAWLRGLKTTYYLRSMGATNAEKATIDNRTLNAVAVNATPNACAIDNPECEACQ